VQVIPAPRAGTLIPVLRIKSESERGITLVLGEQLGLKGGAGI